MTCALGGCERKHYAKSWCFMHYQRVRKNGTLGNAEPHCYIDPIDSFWKRIIKADNGCWNWQGANNGLGYGKLRYGAEKRAVYAHRFAYELLREKIPKGYTIDHLCRNHSCVNPDHLEVVTHKENLMRGNSASAVNARKTHCMYGHEYTEENTYRRPNKNDRECRICIKARSKGECMIPVGRKYA